MRVDKSGDYDIDHCKPTFAEYNLSEANCKPLAPHTDEPDTSEAGERAAPDHIEARRNNFSITTTA